jgi:hypothetical protein
MADAATIDQLELVTDDPRKESVEIGPIQLIRQFRAAQKKYGELISRPLAAVILGVSTTQICVWCQKGRLSPINIGPVHFVALSEVTALYEERTSGDLPVGGRGKKLPTMAEVVRLAAKIHE